MFGRRNFANTLLEGFAILLGLTLDGPVRLFEMRMALAYSGIKRIGVARATHRMHGAHVALLGFGTLLRGLVPIGHSRFRLLRFDRLALFEALLRLLQAALRFERRFAREHIGGFRALSGHLFGSGLPGRRRPGLS